MKSDALGLIELNSIAAGLQVADAMLKAAQVELVISRTICSGKYLIIVKGSVAAVRAAVDSGIDLAEGTVIDHCVIPRVHADILPAVSGINHLFEIKSLGIIESFSVGSLLEAADAECGNRRDSSGHGSRRQGICDLDRRHFGSARRCGRWRCSGAAKRTAGEQSGHRQTRAGLVS